MKKILVIDDADFILESTSTLLRFEGYEVYTAQDGLSGVDATFTYKPDLVLCDISMPGLDGYGVLDKIRSSPETSTTPFIFLTAFTEKANMRTGMEKGADDFLIKPYTRDELIAAIDAQWNKHHLFEKHIKEKVEEVGRNVTYALPHEFRTVLNQVVGSARYMKNNASKITEKEIQETSNDILISAERLLKITENFLIYVRIESFLANEDRRRKLRHFRTDEPGAVVSDIADMIATNYNRKNDLVIHESVEGVSIEISTESFHKIITELVDNAFRFSEPGTPVKLRMWTANHQFFVTLADYGRGMSKEQINNVGAYIQFERTIYEQQGVGLGLVIAKRLVEIHDGSFGILSEEGQGTSVTFSLPCENKEENSSRENYLEE